MRTINLIAAVGILAICGCAKRHVSSQSRSSTTNTSEPPATEAATTTVAMVGTWHCRDGAIWMELSRNERWRWWDLSQRSARPSEPPMLEGSWFVRNGVLFLRIEHTKEEPERIGPGLAFTFDVKSVTPEALVLHQMREEHDMEFRRIADPDGAANRNQPVPIETNQTSQPAGSNR